MSKFIILGELRQSVEIEVEAPDAEAAMDEVEAAAEFNAIIPDKVSFQAFDITGYRGDGERAVLEDAA